MVRDYYVEGMILSDRITILLLLPILALAIMGLIFAIQGQYKPLPFVGQYAEEWFKGITVEQK